MYQDGLRTGEGMASPGPRVPRPATKRGALAEKMVVLAKSGSYSTFRREDSGAVQSTARAMPSPGFRQGFTPAQPKLPQTYSPKSYFVPQEPVAVVPQAPPALDPQPQPPVDQTPQNPPAVLEEVPVVEPVEESPRSNAEEPVVDMNEVTKRLADEENKEESESDSEVEDEQCVLPETFEEQILARRIAEFLETAPVFDGPPFSYEALNRVSCFLLDVVEEYDIIPPNWDQICEDFRRKGIRIVQRGAGRVRERQDLFSQRRALISVQLNKVTDQIVEQTGRDIITIIHDMPEDMRRQLTNALILDLVYKAMLESSNVAVYVKILLFLRNYKAPDETQKETIELVSSALMDMTKRGSVIQQVCVKGIDGVDDSMKHPGLVIRDDMTEEDKAYRQTLINHCRTAFYKFGFHLYQAGFLPLSKFLCYFLIRPLFCPGNEEITNNSMTKNGLSPAIASLDFPSPDSPDLDYELIESVVLMFQMTGKAFRAACTSNGYEAYWDFVFNRFESFALNQAYNVTYRVIVLNAIDHLRHTGATPFLSPAASVPPSGYATPQVVTPGAQSTLTPAAAGDYFHKALEIGKRDKFIEYMMKPIIPAQDLANCSRIFVMTAIDDRETEALERVGRLLPLLAVSPNYDRDAAVKAVTDGFLTGLDEAMQDERTACRSNDLKLLFSVTANKFAAQGILRPFTELTLLIDNGNWEDLGMTHIKPLGKQMLAEALASGSRDGDLENMIKECPLPLLKALHASGGSSSIAAESFVDVLADYALSQLDDEQLAKQEAVQSTIKLFTDFGFGDLGESPLSQRLLTAFLTQIAQRLFQINSARVAKSGLKLFFVTSALTHSDKPSPAVLGALAKGWINAGRKEGRLQKAFEMMTNLSQETLQAFTKSQQRKALGEELKPVLAKYSCDFEWRESRLGRPKA